MNKRNCICCHMTKRVLSWNSYYTFWPVNTDLKHGIWTSLSNKSLSDFRFLHYIHLFPLSFNCGFFFDFQLFLFNFLFLNTTFSIFPLFFVLLSNGFALVFIDFTLRKISFLFFCLIDTFSLNLIFFFFLVWIIFEPFFFNFLGAFLSLILFVWFSC